MILLSAENVGKRFGPEPVLSDATVELRPGDKVGLVGPNGAGKTTFLNILAGVLDHDSGHVQRHPSARFEYLQQRPTWSNGQTLWTAAKDALADLISLAADAEAIAHAIASALDDESRQRLSQRYEQLHHELDSKDAYQLDHRVDRVLTGLGFDRSAYEQPVESLSGGQQNRLLLARLLLREPDVMLLDEPSNHLDLEATGWLETFLANSSQTLIVVSHDRYFLDKVTNRTWELFRGRIDEFVGNFSAYWRQKAERLKVQARTFEKQQEEIAKTEEFIRRNFYGQKSAQAKDREKKLARLERVEPPREISAPPMGFAAARRTGDVVLRADNLAKAYDRALFADLSFAIVRGQRWGILGPNGCGKTTLLRCLVGQERADAGRIQLGAHVEMGYFDQLQSGLDHNEPAVEAVRPPKKEFNEPQRRALLARFGLTGEAVFQAVGSLSGGERARAGLARLAAAEANFLVLDEPTNHLDLWACDSLERSLAAFDGTVLFVSHDRYFLNRVADHLIVVEPDRFRIVEGNYDTYLYLSRQKSVDQADDLVPGVERPRFSQRSEQGERRRRRFPYRKVADIEAEIHQRESRIHELHASLAAPEVVRDGGRVKAIQAEVSEHQAALPTLYEHWEEAHELN